MTTQIRAWHQLAAGTTVNLAVSATSQFIDLTATTPGVCAIRVANVGTQVVFIEQVEAAGTTTTVTTGVPVLPNTVEVFTFPNDKVGLAVIAASTGSQLYVTAGEGL